MPSHARPEHVPWQVVELRQRIEELRTQHVDFTRTLHWELTNFHKAKARDFHAALVAYAGESAAHCTRQGEAWTALNFSFGGGGTPRA